MSGAGTTATGLGTTIITGIQDISALLPLLGAQQCEEHVGSALSDGYLYAAVAPISVFGSPGIASAGFKVLIASISMPHWGLLGARKLHDAGFRPSGKNLSLIMMDPANIERHLAETNVDSLLVTSQLEALNTKDLKRLKITATLFDWNVALLGFTVMACLVGIGPYIHFIVGHHRNRLNLFARWAFPLVRLLGSFVTTTSAQFLIQQRLLVIVKKRLVFHALNNEYTTVLTSLKDPEYQLHWGLQTSSDICLSRLEQVLHLSLGISHDEEKGKKGVNQTAVESLEREFGEAKKLMFPEVASVRWRSIAVQVLIALGILASVLGYIGSFSIVQGASDPVGPILWLLLEMFLSVFRMLLWGWNPGWDDLDPIKISLKLGTHPPLSTCTKYAEEIFDDKLLPLVRASEFVRHVRPYTGFIKPVGAADLSIYYTLTRRRPDNSPNSISSERFLFITFVDQNERATRVYYEEDGIPHLLSAARLILHPTYDILHTKILERPTSLAHLPIPGTTLASHYRGVLKQVQFMRDTSRTGDERHMSWGLSSLDPTLEDEKQAQNEGRLDLTSEENGKKILDNLDTQQFSHGLLQRTRQHRSTHQHDWLKRFMSVVESRTEMEVNDWLKGRSSPSTAIEMRHDALVLERFGLESLLLFEVWIWECSLWKRHKRWVDDVTACIGRDSGDISVRLNEGWVRYTSARLADDHATAVTRLTEAKNAFIATFFGVPDVSLRDLKQAWDKLQDSVLGEWETLIEACETEEPFQGAGPRLPFQTPQPNAPMLVTPLTPVASKWQLADYLEEHAKHVKDKFSTNRDIILHSFLTKERERRFQGERNDVDWWIDKGLAYFNAAALGCPDSCPVIPSMVVNPVKWILITQHIIDSEGIHALSRALLRNRYIRLVEFRDFKNDADLATAIRGIIPRTPCSLTTITFPEDIGDQTIAALSEIVQTRTNSGIWSISPDHPSLVSLIAEEGPNEFKHSTPPVEAVTSFTFYGFRLKQLGSPRQEQILSNSYYSSDSKIELRFIGPSNGSLNLVLHHQSPNFWVEDESGGTIIVLKMNGITIQKHLVQSRGDTDSGWEVEHMLLSPNEHFTPGGQCILTIIPEEDYMLHFIELNDQDDMPYMRGA